MQTEPASQPSLEGAESPEPNVYGPADANAPLEPTTTNESVGDPFPTPKTDKPRPHVCGTCARSFARLEHLKRHERSHTKEKPFECPECTRCFARRDLLLRHQQKLHMTNPAGARPKNGRRESLNTASVTGARVRKNSIANGNLNGAGGPPIARPRANTISHIEVAALGMLDGTEAGYNNYRLDPMQVNQMEMGLPGHLNFDYRGMSQAMGNHGNHPLPKLDTHAVNTLDVPQPLHTAPPNSTFGGFDIDQLFSPGTTVNPAQLHNGGSMSSTQPNFTHFTEPFAVQPTMNPQHQMDDFRWMRDFNGNMSGGYNEQAIEESSPSRMSSGDSPGDFNESLNNSHVGLPMQNNFQWQQQGRNQHRHSIAGPFHLEALGSGLPNLDMPQDTVSPNTMHDPTPSQDVYFQQMMQLQQQSQQQSQQQQHPVQQHHPEPLQKQGHSFLPNSLSNMSSESPSVSSSSMGGSARQSSVTSTSTDSITDATRQALLMTLSQPSVFGTSHRKYSQPSISSPLSPSNGRNSVQGPNLPSTPDIRRYVDAFIHYASPHLPVTHVPTLSFEPPEVASTKGGLPFMGNPSGLMAGGGCLILGMAAIGALYEYDHPASKELFDAARKLIILHLEERRKADVTAAANGPNSGDGSGNQTPLWLVQAMLLNVLYGHQCGDKTAADIASNHCAALVSLARGANLAQPTPASPSANGNDDVHDEQRDITMQDGSVAPGDSMSRQQSAVVDLQTQWMTWKNAEERKRTLYCIFIFSSFLNSAYNHTPTIMNSEILLDLPCDEELWSAKTAEDWHALGGLAAAERTSTSFSGALSTLLTANQRQGSKFAPSAYNSSNPLGALQSSGDSYADNELRPSTLGCLVLITALHNYIWETRSRHNGRQWTAQETESMFSHIEPALNAWQAAWKANERHKLERPNPFGLGPLSADSIPLLDLAFVRLFVNTGRSKEAFWHRDFDGMAEELARGADVVQHADGPADPPTADANEPSPPAPSGHRPSSTTTTTDPASPRRERHLRKAAFYAADSLTIACSYNLTYADLSAHELPIQSAMCFFDCAQVLAEWACTVQERVGAYLGVLPASESAGAVDYTQVPALMLLETEDVELFRKIERICESLEAKRFQQENLLAMDLRGLNPAMGGVNGVQGSVNLGACGYGSKVLRVVAMMLEKAVVWPITHVMAKALETQAAHMDARAEASTRAQ